MRKLLKRAALVVAALVALVLLAALVLYVRAGSRVNRHYEVPTADLAIPADSAALARGRHIAESVSLCHGCHEADFGGGAMVDEPGMAVIFASNLTAGRGGVGSSFSDEDYVRAIRHGVNPDGRGLMIMHSDFFTHMGRSDLASLVAYVRSVPPVDRENPPTATGPMGRILMALGMFDREGMALIPAEVIDHEAPVPVAPPVAETAEYGRYLVSISLCTMCHGSALTGGPQLEEGGPPTPDLTAYGRDDAWTADQFVGTIRTGVTPYGRELDPDHMPWKFYGGMTDTELRAIRAYIASLDS